MKKLMVLSLVMAGMVLSAGISTPTHAQTPPNDLKPTFISPTPGLYVNGWPAFTVSYPKEWVELPPGVATVFEAGGTRPGLPPSPVLTIVVFPTPLPLEEWAKVVMPVWVEYYTDIKVLSDKPSQLKDGTPAREIEVEYVTKDGRKLNDLLLATKKGLMWFNIILTDDRAKIGEDLKRIAYSLTFLQGREEPVQMPPDVPAFLDMNCADMVSRDLKAIMAHFSDRFLYSGASKPYMERFWRNDPTSPINGGSISCEATVTAFEPRGDKAYLDGFWLTKTKGDANAVKLPIYFQQIINEHGQWKWYGNQK